MKILFAERWDFGILLGPMRSRATMMRGLLSAKALAAAEKDLGYNNTSHLAVGHEIDRRPAREMPLAEKSIQPIWEEHSRVFCTGRLQIDIAGDNLEDLCRAAAVSLGVVR
jgi:hypothetical protein